jgi:hypothetical protein
VSVAGVGFALSCSDTRISVLVGNKYQSVDEKFNKHIVFHSAGLTANVSYTGFAQWSESGNTVKMYDVISESLEQSVKKSLTPGPLIANLARDVLARLEKAHLTARIAEIGVEFHIVGRHQQATHGRCGRAGH